MQRMQLCNPELQASCWCSRRPVFPAPLCFSRAGVVNRSGMLGARPHHGAYRFSFFIASTISMVSTLTRVTRMRRSITFSFVIGKAICVELLANGWIFRCFFLELVEYPFQRRAIAEPVGARFCGNAVQLRFGVEHDDAAVLVSFGRRFRRQLMRPQVDLL
jgi:hypothetical protein